MTATERLSLALVWAVAGMSAAFLMAPLVVTVAVSFGSSAVFTLPPPAWSTRWYERLWASRDIWPALATSLRVAGLATALALVLGTLCAIAVVRGRFPRARSPGHLPDLAPDAAGPRRRHRDAAGFRTMGLRDVALSLLVAHGVITLPYVVRNVVAALSLFDFTLIDAARTLGLSYPAAILRVLVPGLAPAFLTSGLFAFLASMDNYPISIFFTDAWTKTLPIQMLQLVEERPDPTVAAVSTLLILLAVAVLIVGDRLVGLRRLAEV